MKKLCYVLPRFDPNSPTHLVHLHEILQRINGQVDLLLVYGSSTDVTPDIDAHFVKISAGFRPIKAFRYLAALTTAYIMGYRSFYVHYHTLSSLWASLLCRIFGGRTYVFCCVKNELYFTPWRLRYRELRRRILIDLPVRLSYRWAQRVVTCSDYMRSHILENHPIQHDRVKVLEHWVNLRRLKPVQDQRSSARTRFGLNPDDQVVLFLHTLGEHKGAHHLPELARRVLAACPQVHFLVAGDGPYRSKLAHEIRSNDLQSQVHLLGAVPNLDVPQLFAAADIYINPATVEEFGRVLLEAMACGVPFVSTDGGGGVLAFTTPRQQEYVTRPNDIENFSGLVVKLLRSPDERKSLKEEGLNHVQGYSLDIAAERFIDIIEDRVGSRRTTT